MSYNERMIEIFRSHGITDQMEHTEEELNEFFEAVLDYMKNPTLKNRNHMEDEFGDVQVLLNQFKLIFELNEKFIVKHMKYKVDRQCKRDNINTKERKGEENEDIK